MDWSSSLTARLRLNFALLSSTSWGHSRKSKPFQIEPDDDGERRRQDIIAAVHAVDSGDGVVVATDMFGGTPSNLAISVMDECNIEVIAGVNLPLLVKLASVRSEKTLIEAIDAAKQAGRKYITVASQLLDEKGS